MLKRMRHRHHGFSFAHDTNEEAYLRKLGWIEESELFPEEVPSVPEVLPEASEPDEVAEVKRRPGRPRVTQ